MQHVWGRGEVYTGVLVGRPEGSRDYLGDPDVDGRLILRQIFRKQDGGMDWIEMTQYSDRWHALMNVLMNLWVPHNARNFLTNWKTVLLKNDSAPCSNSLPRARSDIQNTKQGNFSCQTGGYRRPCSSLLRYGMMQQECKIQFCNKMSHLLKIIMHCSFTLLQSKTFTFTNSFYIQHATAACQFMKTAQQQTLQGNTL